MGRDPLRLYLVLRRGAIAELARAGELAGAAAVACLRTFETQPEHAETIAAWRERPGKVCLRARTPRSGSRSSPSRTRSPARSTARPSSRCRRAGARNAGRCSSACRR